MEQVHGHGHGHGHGQIAMTDMTDMTDMTYVNTFFSPYFDYIGTSDPKYSFDPNALYINAYIVEYTNKGKYTNKVKYTYEKDIITITDINENIIDITDSINFDLIQRIKNPRYRDYYPTYDIARHNMIYIIYFGKPEICNYNKYTINIYKTIRDKFVYTGNSYYYDKNGAIVRKCFHINGLIEGKFYGYHYSCKSQPTTDRENLQIRNDYDLSTSTNVIIYEIDYVNGKMHGKYLKKYDNGQIHTECNFIDGKINGKMCSYHHD
jgi:hypothetical protein